MSHKEERNQVRLLVAKLELILEKLTTLEEKNNKLALSNFCPIQDIVKDMPKGYRSISTLRKLTVGSNPPILSYTQKRKGSPILVNPQQVFLDIQAFERQGCLKGHH